MKSIGLIVLFVLSCFVLSCSGSKDRLEDQDTVVDGINWVTGQVICLTSVQGVVKLGDVIEVREGDNLVRRVLDVHSNAEIHLNAATGPRMLTYLHGDDLVSMDYSHVRIRVVPMVGMQGRLIDVRCGKEPNLIVAANFQQLCRQLPDMKAINDKGEERLVLEIFKTDFKTDPCRLSN